MSTGQAAYRSHEWKIGGGWGCHISWLSVEPTVVVERRGWRRRRHERVLREVYGHQPLMLEGGPQFPKPGDTLTAEMKSGLTAMFRFVEVERQRDPDDMFVATVEDVGYVDG